MKNITDAFIPSNSEIIPKYVQKAFRAHFQKAINVEWNANPTFYEAIFYLQEVEFIAKFSLKGQLLEFKKNIWIDEIPELIKCKSQSFGEIMSAIIIDNGTRLRYELITQNISITRHLLLYDDSGTLLDSKKLSPLNITPL